MGRTVHFRGEFCHFSGSHLLLTLCNSLRLCLQILTNPNHHFVDSSLYKDVILVAWDPAPYSANLNVVRCLLGPFFLISLKALEKMNVFSTAVSWFSVVTRSPKSAISAWVGQNWFIGQKLFSSQHLCWNGVLWDARIDGWRRFFDKMLLFSHNSEFSVHLPRRECH